MPKMIDISPLISPQIAVWTGDTPFSQEFLCRFDTGSNLDLSTITTTVHLGAHTDAPSHYHPTGETMESRSLELYYGPCQIITVDVPMGKRILPVHLNGIQITAERVLFHTKSFPDPNYFNTDFNALSPELINYCAERGVKLIGLDTPRWTHILRSLRVSQRPLQTRHGGAGGSGADGCRGWGIYLIALPLKFKVRMS